MVVSEGAISNIMGGMENTAGVRLHSHRHKLKQRFDIIRKLGQGTYGKVQLAINKDTGQEVAIKTIKKAKIETEQDLVRIRREIQIMSSVQHPQIIHIYEVFENREKMVLVMEYAAGGELYDYLSERKVLSIDEARRVFRQVASAVYYCHKHKICHRDLKLENILLDIDGNAKIADFGLSNVFDEKRRLDTFCGSPLYASPEIVKGVPYVGPEVDCWSLGVLLYTLVYGAMPFDGSNFRRLVKQITQGDYYEPATPSSASPLVRGMLTVTAEKRANIADICSHWWVNEGHSTCCLDEAEALANQTPVRLDLLLSLAPKHISSEHMLIQPDDEDNSHRSEEGEQYSTSEIQLAPVPPVPPPPNGPQAAARSLSLGALTSAVARGADMAAVAPRRDEDKRRRESQAPATEAKKRKEADATSGHKSEAQLEEHEEEKRKARRKTTTRDEDGQEKTERKKSSRKKDAAVEGSPMETDDKLEKRASKTRETSIGDAEKVVNKGSSKTRDTTSASRESVKKRTAKKKELTDDKSSPPKSSVASMDTEVAATPSRDSTPKAPSPVEEMPKATRKSSHVSSETSSNTESKVASIRSPSNKSVISAISTDGTLRASDSSISTRHSVSPPKPVATAVNYNESKPPIKQVSSSTVSKPLQEDKVSKAPSTTRVVKTNSVAKVSKTTSPAKVSKNSSATKLSSSVVNGSCHDISNDTDKVLKETVSKIKEQNGSSTELIENKSKPAKRKTSNDALATNESVSSKESSQHSSVDTTPARSRTGSESSNEARSGGRQDSGSRRGSKIFSKAAMWDNMCNQQQNEKPPPSADKTRKTPRPGGLNMSDLTKKFEEKPPSDRKKPVVGSFKISDVKKSFENKSSDKVGAGFRRTSTDSSVDFKKEDSLPLSPSRSLKKEASLPPPGKSIRKVDSSIVEREKPVLPPKEKESSPVKETTKHVEKSDNEVIVEKDKPVNKAAVTSRGSSSPTKDVPKKAKSPVKEHTPKRDIGRGRDVTTPKRTSPIKDKPKAVSIAIKKTVATHPAPRRDVVTSDIERTKAPDNKEKTRPPSIGVATTERITSPPPTKFESSDSSDSESEAERLLRQLSERRERIEAAKKEKLRKVSQQQQQQREENEKSSSESSRISRPCRTGERTAAKSSLPPLETPSDTPDDMIPVKPPRSIPQASMISDAEQPSGAKYATLPRGFKSRAAEKEYDNKARKKSEVEIVLNTSTQKLLNKRAATAATADNRRSSYAEIQLATAPPPHQEYKSEVRHSIAPSSSRPSLQQQKAGTPPMGDGALQRAPRERIIPIMMEEPDEDTSSGASAAINTSKGEPPFIHTPMFQSNPRLGLSSAFGGGGVFGPSGGLSSSRGSMASSAGSSLLEQPAHRTGSRIIRSPEPIRKCRRERIIPICLEGDEGAMTPNTLDLNRPPHHHTSTSSSTSSHGYGRRLLPQQRSNSNSSNDEDDEDDDAFQSLTAESLFSSLLNKMRNLTKKMSQEEGRGSRGRLLQHHPMLGTVSPLGSFQHSSSPFSSSSLHNTMMHKPLRQTSHESFVNTPPGGGFWSSLYSPPREMSRQNSELSGEGGGSRSGGLSRDPSQDTSSSLGGDPGAPYNTLPRGWRSRQQSEEERASRQLGEGRGRCSGEASGRAGGITEQQNKTNDERSSSAARLATSAHSLLLNSNTNAATYGGANTSGSSGAGNTNKLTNELDKTSKQNAGVTIISIDASKSSIVDNTNGNIIMKPYSTKPLNAIAKAKKAALASSVGSPYKPLSMTKSIGAIGVNNLVSGSVIAAATTNGEAPKRSSSATISKDTGGSEAKKQLQKLVEELESCSEPVIVSTTHFGHTSHTPASLLNSESQVASSDSAQASSKLASSLLSKPKSLSSVTAAANSKTTTAARVASVSSVSKSSEFAASDSKGPSSRLQTSSAQKISSPTSRPQIPEPVAKINLLDTKAKTQLHVSHNLNTGKYINTPANEMKNLANTLKSVTANNKSYGKSNASQKTLSDIPVTILEISTKNNTMTQSLPSDQLSTVLEESKKNRSSVYIESGTDLNKNHNTNDVGGESLNNANNSAGKNQLANGTPDLALIENSTSLIRNTSSNTLIIESRDTVLSDPTKNLFPCESRLSTINISSNASTCALDRAETSLTTTPHKRGKSEDLRSAIDAVGKIDSSFERYKRAAAATEVAKVRPYRGSRSRELNPTIEAASEKISQLNSSNLKKISPFEAYRRSKSRDLGATIELLQKQSSLRSPLTGNESKTRMISPPPPGLPQSPTSIARLTSSPPPAILPRAQAPSPPASLPVKPQTLLVTTQVSDVSPQSDDKRRVGSFIPTSDLTPTAALGSPSSPSLDTIYSNNALAVNSEPSSLRNSPTIIPNVESSSNSPTFNISSSIPRSKTTYERAKTKLEKKIERAKSPTYFLDNLKPSNDNNLDMAAQNKLQNELNSGVIYDASDFDKTKDKIKNNSSSESDKPKSMYKMLTSKFNKPSTNTPDGAAETNDQTTDDKFKLKRPSIFLKGKTEKSPSRTSINETDTKDEPTERKTSRKLSDALNKFLGRKPEDSSKSSVPAESKCTHNIPSAATTDLARSEKDIIKKPSRYRSKIFSKSHENLNKYNDVELTGDVNSSETTNPNMTIESVTKSICDHLTQLESDITNRIGSMDSSSDLRESKGNLGVLQNRTLVPATSVASLNSYGYSPALTTRRIVATSTKETPKPEIIMESEYVPSRRTSDAYKEKSSSKTEADTLLSIMSCSTKPPQHDIAESVKSAPEDGRCFSPTSWCGDSVTSAPDNVQSVLSEEEEESVMDRITRKSFYSRFQEGKRWRSKIIQPSTKQDEDQQLAAAKARLMQDDRRRESLSPQRARSPSRVCARTSIGSSIPEWETAVTRRSSRRNSPRRTSLPSNEYDSRLHRHTADDVSLLSSYREGSRDRGSVSIATAAGAAAGYQAAERGTSLRRSIEPPDRGLSSIRCTSNRESSLSRIRSPSPTNRAVWSPPPHDVVVSNARDEISKRLTPLTRFAASSRDSSLSSIRPYRRTTTTGNLDLPMESSVESGRIGGSIYRRTTTTGNLELPQESTRSLPRPTYRRTNTMHLPGAETGINKPSDFRRLLQPVNRRYSTASLSYNENNNNRGSDNNDNKNNPENNNSSRPPVASNKSCYPPTASNSAYSSPSLTYSRLAIPSRYSSRISSPLNSYSPSNFRDSLGVYSALGYSRHSNAGSYSPRVNQATVSSVNCPRDPTDPRSIQSASTSLRNGEQQHSGKDLSSNAGRPSQYSSYTRDPPATSSGGNDAYSSSILSSSGGSAGGVEASYPSATRGNSSGSTKLYPGSSYIPRRTSLYRY